MTDRRITYQAPYLNYCKKHPKKTGISLAEQAYRVSRWFVSHSRDIRTDGSCTFQGRHGSTRALMPSISFKSDAVCQGSLEGLTAVCGVTATARKRRFGGPETPGRQFLLGLVFGSRL